MAGKILDLSLINFMTYDYCKFSFGEHLNLVIGPNGVGKSSIMCAITLALGGKTNIVARATSLASYIKHGQQEAEIHLTLKKNEEHNIKVIRKISVHNKSSWSINGRSASPKQIDDLTASLNIQINNLCTFLPQDRVQDFAKMNNQDLLENTLKVVGSHELLEQLQEIKDLYAREINTEKDLISEQTRLDTEIQKNASLQIDKENFQKKKNFEKELKCLYQKKKWGKYSLMKQDLKKMNKKLEDSKTHLDELNKKLEPFKKEQEKLFIEKNKFENELRVLSKKRNEKVKYQDDFKNKITNLKDKIRLNKSNYENELENEEKRQIDINNMQLIINGLEEEIKKKKELDLKQIQEELEELQINTKQLSDKNYSLEEQKNKLLVQKSKTSTSIKDLNDSLARLANVENNRLKILEKYSSDAVTATSWLRENKNKFQDEVYEPLILHINAENMYAKYLENSVNNQDLIAFGCTDKKDMNKLLVLLREEKDLRINVLHTPDVEIMQSRIPIESLKHLGLNMYLSNVFTAPKPIKSYLTRNYGLHNIPVGGPTAANNRQKISEQHINLFFSENTRISSKVSKYSGQISSAHEQINEAHLLSSYVDLKQIEEIKKRIKNLSENENEFINQLQRIDQEIIHHKEEINQLNEKKKHLSQQLEILEILKGRLRTKQIQLRNLNNKGFDANELKENYLKNYKKLLKEILVLLPHSHMELLEMQNINWEMELTFRKSQIIENCLKNHEISIKEIKKTFEETEKIIRELRGLVREKEISVRDAFIQAQEATGGLTPKDDSFKKIKKNFEKLPDDIDDINNRIESIRASMDCLGHTNESVLEDFRNREKLIESLKETINKLQKGKEMITTSLLEIKNSWVEDVTMIINKLNQSFCQYFSEMKCAGEIQLHISPEKPNDANEYGLKILVKFRDNEILQELNRFTQSGGERAISTALYIIAMQSSLKVPFVAVDEINQGMDVDNERHVMNLLVKIASEGTTGQYFLLTPKLIPSIIYNEYVDVIIIHNGAIVGNSSLLWTN